MNSKKYDVSKYSNYQNVWKLGSERAEPFNVGIDAGFMPRIVSVQRSFDQNLSKFGNDGLIGKPRYAAGLQNVSTTRKKTRKMREVPN